MRLTSEQLAKIKAQNGYTIVSTTNPSRDTLPHSKPECDQAPTLGRSTQRKTHSVQRFIVRFTGYRVRPLDPDNFAGSVKDLLDGLRHAGLIPEDNPWTIKLETEQVKVSSFVNERTEVEIISPELSH